MSLARDIMIAKAFGGGGGGGGGALVVTSDGTALDKTWQEIHDALPMVWVLNDGAYGPVVIAYELSDQFWVGVWDYMTSEAVMYVASSTDGYPVLDQ